jgi:glycosyltransferase involved in cell wall biosynthesis
MKIAFLSVRGIPNNYGGFEQFAEYISVGLVQRGHEVTVYSPHYHPYQELIYKGVRIKHIYSPELWMGGSVGSFFYDYLSLKDALKKEDFDIIYDAGYTSIIPAYIRFNVKNIRRPIFTTNMDGLEYKRTKFNKWVQKFVFWEERMAVKHSHYLIADNMGIKDYYKEKYGKESKFLAYGATIHDHYNADYLKEYGLKDNNYFILVARLEPENNIYMAIDGYLASDQYGKRPLVIVGKTNTPYGKKLVEKYGSNPNVKFVGGIYDFDKLNSIRHFSYAYFHGHCVGGTNPSLLEAMASECFILSHDNVFNHSVLGENAIYYKSTDDVMTLINGLENLVTKYKDDYTKKNLEVIRTQYSWDKLVDEHEKYFMWMLEDAKKRKEDKK